MIGLIKTLFSWPNGIVVGNLIASALWAAPALRRLHKKLDRHHEERMKAAGLMFHGPDCPGHTTAPPGDSCRAAWTANA